MWYAPEILVAVSLDRLCYGNLYDGARGLARRRIFRVSIRLEVTLS
jgi:hypothetical protein